MDKVVDDLQHLSQQDIALLHQIEQDLGFLADLSQADVLMYCLGTEGEAIVIAQAQPHSILPIYNESLIGQRLTADAEPALLRTLAEGRSSSNHRLLPGPQITVVQQILPVRSPDGRVLAAASITTTLFGHERHRRRSRIFQQALRDVQILVLSGTLRGIEHLSPIGEYDGILVVDGQHNIRYVSGIAANVYRKAGYIGQLEGRCIEELDIDDHSYVVTAIDKGECLETETRVHERIWVKKAIPLSFSRRPWLNRLAGPNGYRALGGALLVISDVTDQRRQEHELQIKVTMIREIHHRVKNNLQTIVSLLRMQARRSDSEVVHRALHEGISRILSVAIIHEFLAHQDARVINIRDVGQRIISQIREGVLDREKRVQIELSGGNIQLPTQQATACALVINELIQNALEHGYDDKAEGSITVNLQDGDDTVTIRVDDDGAGLPEAFDLSQATSLGLQIVQSLVESDLKGSFLLQRRDKGVSATVTFPKQVQGGN